MESENQPGQTGDEQAQGTEEPQVDPAASDEVAEDAIEGDQGEQVPTDAQAGFDPDAPVATSPLPPEAQSGEPQITEGNPNDQGAALTAGGSTDRAGVPSAEGDEDGDEPSND